MRARALRDRDFDVVRLMPNEHMPLYTSAQLGALPWMPLIHWCYRNARYGLVTKELVGWLHSQIDGRFVIEVGAGMGDLGHHLGCKMTDSGIQATPLGVIWTQAGHAPTIPPRDVERIDGAQAVAKYKPKVVIASWVTQLWRETDSKHDQSQSFGAGLDEEALIGSVETYIHIGNLGTHGGKRALRMPHRVYEVPWLWSRSLKPELNRIWVWGGR